jgi:hypothetical protein
MMGVMVIWDVLLHCAVSGSQHFFKTAQTKYTIMLCHVPEHRMLNYTTLRTAKLTYIDDKFLCSDVMYVQTVPDYKA